MTEAASPSPRRTEYILAIDHGTSGVKSSLVTMEGQVVATESEHVPLVFKPKGGVEQDPEHWWQALLRTATRLLGRGIASKSEVRGISVSSTFSTLVATDKHGTHLMNAITWMDTRGAPYIARYFGGFPAFRGYSLPTAARWIHRTAGVPTLTGKDDLAHALLVKFEFPEVYRQTHKFLPSKDYLNLRLTGRHASSFDSVSLFWLTDTRDIHNVHYDDELVRHVELDKDLLPELLSPTAVLGSVLPGVAASLGIESGTPVFVGSPDHQAAGLGSGGIRDFDAHLYVGTSSWIQCNVPFKKTDPLHSIASLPTTVEGKYYCANEQDLAGGCLDYLLHNILCPKDGLVPSAPSDAYAKLDAAASGVPAGSGNVIFTPWLNGERTPVDEHFLRGSLFNLSQTTTQAHIVRAVMEGVAYNTRWSLGHVERFIGRRLPYLRLIGGAALSDTWCQILADVSGREMRRMQDPRAANARGAAMIAMVGLGRGTFESIGAQIPVERVFVPDSKNRRTYDRMFKVFLRLYRNNRSLHAQLQTLGADG